jgi:hypothetical protein
MLGREIQQAGAAGHDSIEDAHCAMELALLKLHYGDDVVRLQNHKLAQALAASHK